MSSKIKFGFDYMKKCVNCFKMTEEKDFLLGSDKCYRCVYEIKKKNQVIDKKNKKCKICKKEILISEYYKKKPRSSFCSEECAKIGHNDVVNNYWTRRLRATPI
jgi:hypothetical protein